LTRTKKIKLSKNSVLHDKSKHIDVKLYFLRDIIYKEETIDLIHYKNEIKLLTYSLRLYKDNHS